VIREEFKKKVEELQNIDLDQIWQGRKSGVEENVKIGIIRPLFEYLGWEVGDFDYNFPARKGWADLALKHKGKVKVIVETKSLEIKKLDDHKTQALEYARNKGVDWAVLTNGMEIRLYKSYISGVPDDRNKPIAVAHLRRLVEFDEFDKLSEFISKDKFDKIEEKTQDEIKRIRESIKADDLLKLLDDYKKKLTVDIKEKFHHDYSDNEEFKHNIDSWIEEVNLDVNDWISNLKDDKQFRDNVEHALKKIGVSNSSWIEKYKRDADFKNVIDGVLKNEGINTDDWIDRLCEEGVYTIINRLLFLRICEDRGFIEKKLKPEILQAYKITKPQKYASGLLLDVFESLRDRFEQIYELPIFDHIAFEKIEWNETLLEELITKLTEYNFRDFRRDIIGDVYENHLSPILKKKTGTYYTPSHIIECIVDATFNELDDKNLENTKILDPAVGSGSFLLQAYDRLRDMYKHKKESKPHSKILENNLYGVDINPFAVQLSTISLALKDLDETSNKFNIVDGDSILGKISLKYRDVNLNDFEEKHTKLLRKKESAHVKLLDIFDQRYDVVIGNPPYFNMQTTTNKAYKTKGFMERWKDVYTGENDILYYFIAQGIDLLKNKGYLGYITTRYWLEATYARKLREYILNNSKVKMLIDFRDVQIFEGVGNHTCIVILQKEENLEERQNNTIKVVIVKQGMKIPSRNFEENNAKLLGHITKHLKEKQYEDEFIEIFDFDQSKLSDELWIFVSEEKMVVLEKIQKNAGSDLSNECLIGEGFKAGLNEAFVVDTPTIERYRLEKDPIRKMLKNSDIHRYYLDKDSGLNLLYLTNETLLERYPNIKKYLEQFKEELESRYQYKTGVCKWFSLSNPQNRELFDKYSEKIICPYRASENTFAYDNQKFYGLTDIYAIIPKDTSKLNIKYLLALLNSKTLDFYFRETGKKKGSVFEYFTEPLSKIPIKTINFDDKKEKQDYEELIKLVDSIIEVSEEINKLDKKMEKASKVHEGYYEMFEERKKLAKERDSIDKEINKIVYDLYDLSRDDIKIIESKK